MTGTGAPSTVVISHASHRPTTSHARGRAHTRERIPCSSFEDGYAWLLPFAYNVGYRFHGGDTSFAEDVAQEALTRAFIAWTRVRRHPNPEAWITVTAFRVALELDRRQRRAGRPTSISATTPQSNDERRVADTDHLAQAMRRLSTRQQQVIVWRFYFDQSIRQTAQRLGLSETKVKDATHEALIKLARIMRSDGSAGRLGEKTAISEPAPVGPTSSLLERPDEAPCVAAAML
jgi:RNA polymerase sigma factor (sigma-70 family)